MRLIPTIVLLVPLLGTGTRALAAGAGPPGSEPLCYPDEDDCRVAEATTDPSRLLCAPPAPSMGDHGAAVRDQAALWGRVFGVPARWVTSQAEVESRNRPGAVSPAMATGVMQVKVSRAADLVRWLKRSEYWALAEVRDVVARAWRGLRADLHDLQLNVMLATFDLRRLAGKFGRDHAVVAAAYNQGEGKIGRCLREGRPLPARAVEYVSRVERVKRAGKT